MWVRLCTSEILVGGAPLDKGNHIERSSPVSFKIQLEGGGSLGATKTMSGGV